MVLDQLVPNKSKIFWASKQFEGQTNEIEPWCGTAFSVENINDDLVKRWEVSQPDTRLGCVYIYRLNAQASGGKGQTSCVAMQI